MNINSDFSSDADRPSSISVSQTVQVPSFYFNSFNIGLSNADINMLIMTGNQPIAALNMSYTTAKSLYRQLSGVIQSLEEATGRKIMTTEEVGQGLEKQFSNE